MSQITAEEFAGFERSDFEVFEVPGLEPRMEALIERVRPKLTWLGENLSGTLSQLCGEPMHPHVARHARRKVNPPNDTWVAFAGSKRGYKALPHFQIGLWSTYAFIQFAVIYECPGKEQFAERALRKLTALRKALPAEFVWSGDHTTPETVPHGKLSKTALAGLFERLRDVKSAEITCGLRLDREEALLGDGKAFVRTAEETFERLLPLYRLAK